MTEITSWREEARERLEKKRDELIKLIENKEEEMEQEEDEDSSLDTNPQLYWAIVIAYIVLLSLLAVTSLALWDSTIPFVQAHTGLVLLALLLGHLYLSSTVIGVDKLAGFDLFGRPLYNPRSGLYFTPYPFVKTIIVSRNYQDIRFPGEPGDIFRVSSEQQKNREGGDMPPEGKVRPVFLTTGEAVLSQEEEKRKAAGKANPLNEQLTIEISWYVRYRPNQKHGSIWRIVRNLAANTGDIDDAIKDLMREQTERDVKELGATQTTASIIENLGLFNEVFFLKVKLYGLSIGIQIQENGAGLASYNITHETNDELQMVARAGLKFKRAVIEADAEKEKRIREGAGAAEAERLRLVGLARGYRRIMKEAGVDGDSVIASETAKLALAESNTTILGAGSGYRDLLSIVKAGSQMLSDNGAKEEKKREE